MFRLPNLALGELEQHVLEALWQKGPLPPAGVHHFLGNSTGRSINTVSSALKRLYEKGLLHREKVSHAYVYSAKLSRTELQKQFLNQIAHELGGDEPSSFLAAFVDLAETYGEDTLRQLEQLVSDKLSEGDT